MCSAYQLLPVLKHGKILYTPPLQSLTHLSYECYGMHKHCCVLKT